MVPAGKSLDVLFPFGTVIWRLNVLSALFGGLAAAFLFGAARALSVPRPVVPGGGPVRIHAHVLAAVPVRETYSMTACYTAAMLLLALRWRARGCGDAGRWGLALVCGLAMTNGQINTLFLPGFIAFVLWCRPDLRRLQEGAVRVLCCGRSAGLLPLLFYAYLPLRAMTHPAADWGDPETPYAFFYHVTGRPYAHLMFHLPPLEVLHNLGKWASGLGGEYPWPLIVVSGGGLAALWHGRETRPVALLLSWVIAADMIYTINYAIYNQYIYFMPVYLVVALLIGQGLWSIWPRLAAAVTPQKRPLYQVFAAACLLLLVPFQCAAHWGRCDLHRVWACYDYQRNILESLPPDALLIDNGDDTTHAAAQYLQVVEHERPDIIDIHRQLLMSIYDLNYRRFVNICYWDDLKQRAPYLRNLYPGRALTPHAVFNEDLLRAIIARATAAGHPVAVLRLVQPSAIDYRTGHFVPLLSTLTPDYDPAPAGLVMRLYPHGKRPGSAVLLAQNQAAWRGYSLHSLSGSEYIQDEYLLGIALDYAGASLARARLAYALGDYDTAESAYQFVLRLFRSPEAAAGMGRCAQARAHLRRLAQAPSPA